MTGVVAYLALVIVVPALLLGHQGQDWPLRGAWRLMRPTARTPPTELPFPALIAARRRPQPSWALPGDTEALSASPTPESEKESLP